MTLADARPEAAAVLGRFATGEVAVSRDGLHLRAPVTTGSGLAGTVVRALDEAGIGVDDVEIRPPSLDDVFFALTGHPAEAPADAPADAPSGESGASDVSAASDTPGAPDAPTDGKGLVTRA